MPQAISITALSSLSPLGNNPKTVWQNYLSGRHFFSNHEFSTGEAWAAFLDPDSQQEISELKNSDNKYKSLDPTVLYAIAAARKALSIAGWKQPHHFGINIGSSRGATEIFEKHHKDFLSTGKAHTLASPTTTLGNISSWVAHDLQSDGPEVSHSITCSTSLHALLNGVAWLRSGMAEKFLVGGSEAPLTDFTIAQMQALKIYSRETGKLPSRAADFDKSQNTMILGEGAAMCCLEIGEKPNAIALIDGIGYATEVLLHNTSISAAADCFQKSMRMALADSDSSEIDAIVMHAPGTVKGDLTELRAIEAVFGSKLPQLTTNKWMTGHTFGASGILSVEMAVLMLQHQQFIAMPFSGKAATGKLRRILVNSVGFGGNAVSVILRLP